jgi:hypothetical protein
MPLIEESAHAMVINTPVWMSQNLLQPPTMPTPTHTFHVQARQSTKKHVLATHNAHGHLHLSAKLAFVMVAIGNAPQPLLVKLPTLILVLPVTPPLPHPALPTIAALAAATPTILLVLPLPTTTMDLDQVFAQPKQ